MSGSSRHRIRDLLVEFGTPLPDIPAVSPSLPYLRQIDLGANVILRRLRAGGHDASGPLPDHGSGAVGLVGGDQSYFVLKRCRLGERSILAHLPAPDDDIDASGRRCLGDPFRLEPGNRDSSQKVFGEYDELCLVLGRLLDVSEG
jgi:hypothetical protein